MTDDEDNELQASMDAHRKMFGECSGPPYGCVLSVWIEALQEAVTAGKPADSSRFFPADPDMLA